MSGPIKRRPNRDTIKNPRRSAPPGPPPANPEAILESVCMAGLQVITRLRTYREAISKLVADGTYPDLRKDLQRAVDELNTRQANPVETTEDVPVTAEIVPVAEAAAS